MHLSRFFFSSWPERAILWFEICAVNRNRDPSRGNNPFTVDLEVAMRPCILKSDVHLQPKVLRQTGLGKQCTVRPLGLDCSVPIDPGV